MILERDRMSLEKIKHRDEYELENKGLDIEQARIELEAGREARLAEENKRR